MKRERIRRGKARLRPRARIIRTIGRDLISNEVVALVELVKNAYDADANTVRIAFEDPLQPSDGGIVVEDDGIGMTLSTIRKAWFEPATISKTRKAHTDTGRRVTGEKGIGRFAAARVAQTMEMESVAKGGRRVTTVRFDWGAFDDEKLYLDQVECRWEESPAPRGRRRGTILRLLKLNDAWDGASFARLRGELSRLISPELSAGNLKAETRFEITLSLPERFSQYAGPVTPPPILGRPHYKLLGEIDAAGVFSAEYTGPDTKAAVRIEGNVVLDKTRVPQSGRFRFEFRAWDREPDDLEPLVRELGSTVRKLREDLNSASGISMYRDGFRILLSDDDWLRLDLRRVQNPTMRLSNNQIVGAVFVSADENRGLRDQSNREGIVSSPAFGDFKRVLIELLSKLEVRRDNYRRGRKKEDEGGSGLFLELDIGPVRQYIEERYPADAELKVFLQQKSQTFEHGIAEVKQVLARYRRLATLGQLIDVVLHDGRTPVAAISNEVELAVRSMDKANGGMVSVADIRARFQVIASQAEVVSHLLDRLAPFSGRKRGRPIPTTIERILADTFALFERQIAEQGIEVSLPSGSTVVNVDPAEIQQVFVNLLTNALYWLERMPVGARKIVVQTTHRAGELEIIFSDSGPGVPEEVRERIFDPYFSTKPDGVGLGLTIAGETVAEHDGSLDLVAGGPLDGATFRVVLRRRTG